jgi:tyrosyl-tRNA synthetase
VDFIDQVGRNISINYLLAKETIKQRLESGLSYSAFSYSLLQAYDFYYLYKNYHCHGQLGGSDQWGNLTTGLKLIRGVYPNGKTFGVTFNMLVDKEGKKLSKSENKSGIIWLDENKTSRQEFYDFFRNMPDPQAEIFIRQFTFLSEEQIKELLKLNRPPRLRILQRILYELVFILNYRYYQKISI